MGTRRKILRARSIWDHRESDWQESPRSTGPALLRDGGGLRAPEQAHPAEVERQAFGNGHER